MERKREGGSSFEISAKNIRDEDIREVGKKYVRQRQQDLHALLDVTVSLSEICNSEVHGKMSLMIPLSKDKSIDLVPILPYIILAVASKVEAELDELHAATPEIIEKVDFVEALYNYNGSEMRNYFGGVDIKETDDPDDPLQFPFT